MVIDVKTAGNRCEIRRFRAIISSKSGRERQWKMRPQEPKVNRVRVTVSGETGSGKSAVMGEIEIALKAIGLTVETDAAFQSEKNMTHADWQTALDMYAPVVALVEVNQTKTDHYGRVWMHCEQGLAMTAASMSRFMLFVLQNNIEIGDVYAFSPKYKRSTVLASVRLKPDQFEAFERETGGKLREPPVVHVNSESGICS